jgi:hypothetical protein
VENCDVCASVGFDRLLFSKKERLSKMDQFDKVIKDFIGDGPIQKHIILLKLTDALENAPDFGDVSRLEPFTPQRQWLSKVGALLSRLGGDKILRYKTSFAMLDSFFWVEEIIQIKGLVLDAIEEIKLELELDGRSDIGNAYAPGDVYRFFADLKEIINSAEKRVMVIDPYFNGDAFDAYFSEVDPSLIIQILADRYSKDINNYIDKHKSQFGSNIELRSSKELHDRVIFVDDETAWIMGGSIKDAGKKATYLIPLATQLSIVKKEIYTDIWDRATAISHCV